MKLNKVRSNTSIAIILLITTIVSNNLNWVKNYWLAIIQSDGKGYYAYLPATFIYNDLNFGFFDTIEKEKYYDANLYYDYRIGAKGKVIDKYYCGTAIAELPFFIIAHAASHLLNYELDGYSKLYSISISIAALFYLFVGLYYLNSSLKTYKINEWQRSFTLFAAVFGTNLFYYTVSEPAMSHIYSFAFISMFYYHALQFFSEFRKKHLLILAIILAIIILIRPINALIVFILPFAAGNVSTLKNGLLKIFNHKLWMAYSFFAFITIISIQLLIYKISTGSFLVYSYGEEGFDLSSPHLFDILFSYKKGLFLYTPLFLLSFSGGYFLWKKSPYKFLSWFCFFLIITYIFSSWEGWFYGGSFSSRVYVEYISLFMILLAIPLKEIKTKLYKYIYTVMIALLIIVCQIQTFQYRYNQIHWSDMTKEKYWDVFMRIDRLI